MSSNKSVQAAQRRRAGPPEPQRSNGPTTSINSAQLFSKQGQGQNVPVQSSRQNVPVQSSRQNVPVPSSRQYVSTRQEPDQFESPSESSANVSQKITINNAITLIGSRLTRLETYLKQLSLPSQNSQFNANEKSFSMDNLILEDIVHRLEDLEGQPDKQSTSSDVKTQLDVHAKTIKQTEIATATIVKGFQNMKTVLESLKSEISELRQNVLDNNEKIENLERIISSENVNNQDEYEETQPLTLDMNMSEVMITDTDLSNDMNIDSMDLTNLKDFVKNELQQEM
jgi:hypothetical protein